MTRGSNPLFQANFTQDCTTRDPSTMDVMETQDEPKRGKQTAKYRRRECRECHDDGEACDGKRGPPLKCSRCTARGSKCLPNQDWAFEGECCNCSMVCIVSPETAMFRCPRCKELTRRDSNDEVSEDEAAHPVDVGSYTQPFISFVSDNPTIFHAVSAVCKRLASEGFTKLFERDSWKEILTRGGKYFFERNGSSVIALVVGEEYESGNGASVIASHIDALSTRLKPIPTLSTKAGYVQLGVAPYAGALNNTWWDRDLGIGGRVLVKDSKSGKIETKLVKLGWPIARIPTLAPHFGMASDISHANKETQMVPIIGLDSTDVDEEKSNENRKASLLGGAGAFTATQPERLVKAIAGEMNIKDCKYSLFSAKL